MLKEIKSVTITEKGQIAIPRNMREFEGFKEGDKIAILAYEGYIELRPMKGISEKMTITIASEKVLSKDWDSKEDNEAWKYL